MFPPPCVSLYLSINSLSPCQICIILFISTSLICPPCLSLFLLACSLSSSYLSEILYLLSIYFPSHFCPYITHHVLCPLFTPMPPLPVLCLDPACLKFCTSVKFLSVHFCLYITHHVFCPLFTSMPPLSVLCFHHASLCRSVPPHIDVHSAVILPDANKLIALSSLSFSPKHVQDWVFPGKVFQGREREAGLGAELGTNGV